MGCDDMWSVLRVKHSKHFFRVEFCASESMAHFCRKRALQRAWLGGQTIVRFSLRVVSYARGGRGRLSVSLSCLFRLLLSYVCIFVPFGKRSVGRLW